MSIQTINNENVLKYYEDYNERVGEENRASVSRSAGLELHYTKKAMREFIKNDSRILEIGCGTGYYGMYFADKCKEYVGLDLFQRHVDIFQHKIQESGLKNLSCKIGDATNLVEIEDSSFDVVCCFGPMYHLPLGKRALVFAECRRVCKTGGIIAFAYINKIGAYMSACLHEEFRSMYPTQLANDYVLKQGRDDVRPDVFFFTMPEEIESAAVQYGLTKIRNIGVNFGIAKGIIDQMDDDKFEIFMEIIDEMVKYESCTGMSEHSLLICKKEY